MKDKKKMDMKMKSKSPVKLMDREDMPLKSYSKGFKPGRKSGGK